MSNTKTTAPELFTVNPEPSYTPIFDELDAHYASLPVNVSSVPAAIDAPVVAVRDTEPCSTASALEIRGVLYLLALGGIGYAGLRAVSYLQYGV